MGVFDLICWLCLWWRNDWLKFIFCKKYVSLIGLTLHITLCMDVQCYCPMYMSDMIFYPQWLYNIIITRHYALLTSVILACTIFPLCRITHLYNLHFTIKWINWMILSWEINWHFLFEDDHSCKMPLKSFSIWGVYLIN